MKAAIPRCTIYAMVRQRPGEYFIDETRNGEAAFLFTSAVPASHFREALQPHMTEQLTWEEGELSDNDELRRAYEGFAHDELLVAVDAVFDRRHDARTIDPKVILSALDQGLAEIDIPD